VLRPDGLECSPSCVCWDVQPICMLGQSVLDMCSARTTKGDSACSLLLGAHRQGHAIPLSVSGGEVGGGETAYTFRQVDLKEDFLLFMSDTLVITAASQETLTMMGVRPHPRMCASDCASSVLCERSSLRCSCCCAAFVIAVVAASAVKCGVCSRSNLEFVCRCVGELMGGEGVGVLCVLRLSVGGVGSVTSPGCSGSRHRIPFHSWMCGLLPTISIPTGGRTVHSLHGRLFWCR
jgi:hypothetical protein